MEEVIGSTPIFSTHNDSEAGSSMPSEALDEPEDGTEWPVFVFTD
jgi:hypothetical protein